MKNLSWAFLIVLIGFSTSSCKSSWQNLGHFENHFYGGEKQIQTTLTPLSEKYKRGEPMLMAFTVSNLGEKTVRVCRWNSPLEGSYEDDFLLISRKKNVAAYHGDKKARKQSFIKSYVSLKPGESLSQTIDLSEAYGLNKKGTYKVKFEGDAYNHLPNSEMVEIKVK